MNTTRNHERIAALAKEIACLDAQVVDTERASLELFGDENEADHASAAVTEIKAKLEKAFRAYYLESECARRAEQSARKAAA